MIDQRINLELPDLPLMYEQGEITPDGQHFINKDIYQGESLHWDHLTPLNPTEAPQSAPVVEFKSGRAG